MPQALVTRSVSKAPDDAPVDGDPNILNFAMVMSWIVGWMSFLPQNYWLNLGKWDGPVLATPNVGHAFSIFSHEDVEGGFWMRSLLASLILLPSANLWIFGPGHPQLSIFSYDSLVTFSRLILRCSNQDLLPIELDRIHISWKRVFVKLHLRTFSKFQSSFVYGRLNLMIKNIAIISSMRIGIMPFTISMPFELFR
jgi:hypothetical protein